MTTGVDTDASHDTPAMAVIDADGHVLEPFTLWSERMPSQFRDLLLRLERLDDGMEILHNEGKAIRVEWTTGTLATPGAAWHDGRVDIDVFTECDPGIWEPRRRLELMDAQGLAVSVLFPSMLLGLCDVSRPDLQIAYARVYNEWIAEFCSVDPVRLRWAAVLPTSDLDACRSIATVAMEAGAIAVMLPPILDRAGRGLGHPDADALLGQLASDGCPVVVHAGNPANACLDVGRLWTTRAQWQMGYSLQSQVALLHCIESGVFDRHPRLRVGFFEGDVGWLPHWLGRMDLTFRRVALVSAPRRRDVLEQFLEHCVVSGDMSDPGLAAAVAHVGAERVLFASDWPHHDGTWPDPILAVRDAPGLSDEQRRVVLCHGPAAFFGIDLDEVERCGSGRWSRHGSVADLGGLLPDGRSAVLAAHCEHRPDTGYDA